MARSTLLIVSLLLLSLPAPVGARNTSLTPIQAEGRLNAIRAKGQRAGVSVAVGCLLLNVPPLGGAKITAGRRGMVIRDQRSVSRVQARGNRVMVEIHFRTPRTSRAVHDRETLTILGNGLATSSITNTVDRQTETSHTVAWKNSLSALRAPLSAAQRTRLRRELASPEVQREARSKARREYGSNTAIPAMELETALSRMGLESSVDWR